MRSYVGSLPIKIDLVYAQENHPENMFKCAIYLKDAPFLLYHSLADIVIEAAQNLYDSHGWTCVLMDGLRPIEAQEAMQKTEIVRQNPHWCTGPDRLLSPPGRGGHPRAMAVDIVCLNDLGKRIDMGTAFDQLSTDPNFNPAARAYKNFPAAIINNRETLQNAMVDAALKLKTPLLPLPSEWWDFRFPASIYNEYLPLADADLPENMRITL